MSVMLLLISSAPQMKCIRSAFLFSLVHFIHILSISTSKWHHFLMFWEAHLLLITCRFTVPESQILAIKIKFLTFIPKGAICWHCDKMDSKWHFINLQAHLEQLHDNVLRWKTRKKAGCRKKKAGPFPKHRCAGNYSKKRTATCPSSLVLLEPRQCWANQIWGAARHTAFVPPMRQVWAEGAASPADAAAGRGENPAWEPTMNTQGCQVERQNQPFTTKLSAFDLKKNH